MLNFRRQALFVLATLIVVPPVLAAAVGPAPVLLLLMPLSAALASGQNIQSPHPATGQTTCYDSTDASGARYPLRIDPLIQQGSKLIPSDESGNGGFGDSVALSSDGNTALIGGPIDKSKVGAAWVFRRSGSIWTQQGKKLTASGESGKGFFGNGVPLSSDGSTALMGGPGDNNGVGAAWVFVNSCGVQATAR